MDKKKLITWGVILVGGALVYKFVFSGKKNKNNGGTGGTGGGTTGGGKFTASQLKSMADEIFDAMDGYGTNEDTILAKFQQIKTNEDFDGLVKAYGTRTVSSGWGNVFMSDYTGDLSGALHSELSSGWINDINDALARSGVNRSV